MGELPDLTEKQVADLEAENGLLQFDRMYALIEEAILSGQPPLTPDTVLELQRLAVDGLEPTAGQFRTGPVFIDGTVHSPPSWEEVPDLVDDMCAYVSGHWGTADPVYLSAYVMWRLNWIHPFSNGNGRTSRVASYLVLCAALRMNLPGDRTVPEVIDEDKRQYYWAHDDADAKWSLGVLDISVMEHVINDALSVQLSDVLGVD